MFDLHDETIPFVERSTIEQWLIQHPAATILGLFIFVFFTLFIVCALIPRW